MVDTTSSGVRERLLTLREAAVYLNVTERFMRRMVSQRRTRFYKIGRLLRFDAFDLDALAADNSVGSGDDAASGDGLTARRYGLGQVREGVGRGD